MWKVATILGLMALLSCGTTWVQAHQATERFIPIGRSPGVSHTITDIGEIVAVNARDRTITVAMPVGTRTVSIEDGTSIWLDRSMLRRSNQTGSFSDLRIGRKVEVRYLGKKDEQSAQWVKVQISAP